jgi:hypothetical protein
MMNNADATKILMEFLDYVESCPDTTKQYMIIQIEIEAIKQILKPHIKKHINKLAREVR